MPDEPGSPLRVAVVHSYYSSRVPSGENVVVDLQVDALRRAGHEVLVVARRTDDLERSRLYPLAAGLRVASGRGYSPAAELDAFAPDVVHVHNLFPNFGRSWTKAFGPRIVTTLHNYRPVCPGATLYRDGQPCSLCPDGGSARPAVTHACYKDSKVQTVPVALGTRFADDPLLASAARVITLNDDMRARYAAFGVPSERLVTVPNFVPSGPADPAPTGDHWLFVGRLSDEKGILPLVRDWPEGASLLVVGSGPLEDEIRAVAGPTVELLGQRDNTEVRDLLRRARGLFFPSVWPEGLPTVYLEALASGTPVVASSHSIVGSLVASEGTGFVTSGSVAADIARAEREFAGLRARCRAVFEDRYTEDAWIRAVEAVYAEVVATAS
ncbi:glycosyltransferase family 4 protein [Marmoricola sp. RAF53]|uniref:glycosyltransferase family 4 protein n=1 Tax=Marmoricola sp. RAF53 TaxID=3233059 RepID=UPI003F97950D